MASTADLRNLHYNGYDLSSVAVTDINFAWQDVILRAIQFKERCRNFVTQYFTVPSLHGI